MNTHRFHLWRIHASRGKMLTTEKKKRKKNKTALRVRKFRQREDERTAVLF